MRPVRRRHLPSLGALATFEVAAKHLSFTLAAKELNINDLALRQEVTARRMNRRANLLERVNTQMPEIEKAVEEHALGEYDKKALELVISGRARKAST